MERRSLVSVVDDDESVRLSLANLLASNGFTTHTFASAEAFLRSDHPETTECVIVDVRLPGMSGLDLQHELIDTGRMVPTIFITAHDDDGDRSRALERGAVAFLCKPFREDILLSAVRGAVQQAGQIEGRRPRTSLHSSDFKGEPHMTILATAHEETIDSAKGIKIFVRSWTPESGPRAVVVICHGVNSHGGQYRWVGEQFAAAGYAVFALDMRGRGRSEGERFYVEDVAEYVSDVANTIALAKSRNPGVPVFLLGHSAGGVVSAMFVLDNQPELAGFICESFAFQVPAPGFALAAIKGISHIAPRLPVLKLKNEDFSRDPKAVEALNNDPLTAHEVQPAITVAALVRADERLREEFPRMTLPLLIMHGTADRATVCHGSQFFYETAGSRDKTLKLYDGHYHDLLNDIGKEQVIDDIRQWIGARAPEVSSTR